MYLRFKNTNEMKWLGSPWFPGAQQKLLSAASGGFVSLFLLPAGWTLTTVPPPFAKMQMEIVVFSGDLTVNGGTLQKDWYGYISAPQTLSSETECSLLMVGSSDPGQQQMELVAFDDLCWEDAPDDPGLLAKKLHQGPSTRTLLFQIPAGWSYDGEEIHPASEKCFVLDGELWLHGQGIFTAGCYFDRDGEVVHGPYAARLCTHALFFISGELSIKKWPIRNGQALTEAYLKR
jgi:hypothetical protein